MRDPLDPDFFATRSIIVGIDSYSDITVAHRDIAYDVRRVSETEIRNLLLDGVHLSPPDYRLPFHGCGDASNDGKSFGLNQYNDLPPGTDFTLPPRLLSISR